jgi:transcription-repair coupling factor (superfamily II helicase)
VSVRVRCFHSKIQDVFITEMEEISRKISQSETFKHFLIRLKNLPPGEILHFKRSSGSFLAFMAAEIFKDLQKQVVLIASDQDRAETLRDDSALLIGEQDVLYYGARPTHHAEAIDVTSSIGQIETLKTLTICKRILVVASPDSIAEKIPPPERFKEKIIDIDLKSNVDFPQLLVRLEEMGFERKSFVETYGDFAVRGGIIDVFPYIGDNPVRFEFWGNTVGSIREFDILSQRSIRELSSVSIVPDITAGGIASASTLTASLFDYLNEDAIVIFDEPSLVERKMEEIACDEGTSIFGYNELFGRASQFRRLVSSNIIADGLKENTVKEEIDFASTRQSPFHGSVALLVKHIRQLAEENITVYLASDTKLESDRLKELINEVITNPESFADTKNESTGLQSGDLSKIKPVYLPHTIHSGFVLPSAKLALLTEHEIFGRLKQRALVKRRRFRGFSEKEIRQLKPGDYVVHADHGIGEFSGLTKIKVGNIEQEVMKLLFLENDVLYVNLNFINRVQKYSSNEGHVPKLHRLGSAEWEKIKSRAKGKIKDIARDLIQLYAKRKNEQGTAFAPDTHWQKELEASFMYEDTPDQTRTTQDVKSDMENLSPMDRLICGDVGFGKTEVAVRAAFKAVMSGKQVAVLVPTTILALQHYNTFLDRLNRYTTRVENITRFKSKKEQSRIVDELTRGSIDIIIGTHRLLSKDIAIKNLGLLIIDEEHRFGVSAKEKLRKLKASVDTLAMTATPIPRTLHFSLIGARDLSLITTPPRNRLPIETDIIPAEEGRRTQWQVIRGAILKEIHRGGQIYFVHDRVQNIDAVAAQVKSHVPESRVHIAHGQMTGHQLEKTMVDFLEKKFDVLVCTKIIESGLDIPNVNTIIINRADRFGLAELYQLRGRVGRTNVQAYAYLLIPPLSVLPRPTLRRLQAIEEFTELGSGFNLAMRDLEIRGAGNLLGAEQSGFILEMGFEMYERVVKEAVEELKQEEFKDLLESNRLSVKGIVPKTETTIEADIEALIPDFYIESDSERLDVYRRLYSAVKEDDIRLMREELRDRFGEYPEEVENLLQLVEVRICASRAGFSKITLKDRKLTVTLPPETDEHFYGKVGDTDSPFQRIMGKISNGEIKNVFLKQQEKNLTLQFTHIPMKDTKEYLLNAKHKIDDIASRLSGS